MTSFNKSRARIFQEPIHNDITQDQLIVLAEQYGCIIKTGGNHQKRIVYIPPDGSPVQRKVIPVPSHGKSVPEIVIKEFKQLIIEIEDYEGGPRK